MLPGNQIKHVEVNYIKNLVGKIGLKKRKCYNLYYFKTLLNLIFTPRFWSLRHATELITNVVL